MEGAGRAGMRWYDRGLAPTTREAHSAMAETRMACGWMTPAAIVLGSSLLLPGAAGAQSLQPAGWNDGLRLAEAVDRNPDPRVVEVDFEARVAKVEIAPGFEVEAWTYNGTIPGPMIRVQVGDRLIVHFTNNLPRPSTIHWHGLRIPIGMDGVPGYSQEPVPPGGTFTYDFVVPDGRHLLVPPARDVGGAGRIRPLRSLPGRGSGRGGDGRDRRRPRCSSSATSTRMTTAR